MSWRVVHAGGGSARARNVVLVEPESTRQVIACDEGLAYVIVGAVV